MAATIDFPSRVESCRPLTGAIAKLAARASSDTHILIYRDHAAAESIVLAMGPSVQDLAERFSLMCRKSSVEGRRLLWIGLNRDVHIGDYLDPSRFDPDAAGRPAQLYAKLPFRWALAILRHRNAVSTRWELELILPPEMENDGSDFFDLE